MYVTFTNKYKRCYNNWKKNELIINNTNYKKIEIDNLLINVKFVDDMLNIKLKVLHVKRPLLILSENIIGHASTKIFKHLLQHCNYS